jgi:hypothetical protein
LMTDVRYSLGSVSVSSRLQEIEEWRHVMGDKGKKDKEKGQKQNTVKQKQKMDKKIEKQPKRAS